MGREIPLAAFPSPEELWRRYSAWKGIKRQEQQAVITQEYYTDMGGKRPRAAIEGNYTLPMAYLEDQEKKRQAERTAVTWAANKEWLIQFRGRSTNGDVAALIHFP